MIAIDGVFDSSRWAQGVFYLLRQQLFEPAIDQFINACDFRICAHV
jgi:hypothetical protein